jgi:hypothetical protein
MHSHIPFRISVLLGAFSLAAASANPVTVTIGDTALPNQIGDGFKTAANGGLSAENGSMWGVSNSNSNRFGLIHDTYSNIAGETLPSTIQPGTYVLTARVGSNGSGGGGFADLNTPTATNASKGLVAGFFYTVINESGGDRTDAEKTKNNMFNEWNGLPSVIYTPPPEARPTVHTFTTWTFTWTIAPDSPLIGTNPNFGVYTKTGAGGGNGFWDDSTLSYSVNTATPVVTSFTASPSSILDDRAVTLSWTTLNANEVSIDGGVGVQSLNGSHQLTVSTASLPLTFTLTATNANATPPDDTATAQVTITQRGVNETPALMACWTFDGDLTEDVFGWSATRIDGGDNVNDITFDEDVPEVIADRRSQSVHFTGDNVDDYIVTGFTGVAGSSARSVSYWVKANINSSSVPFSYGMDFQGRAFISRIDPSGLMGLGFRQSTEILTAVGTVPIDGSAWTHIALVYAGISGNAYENATIYVNGTGYNQIGFAGTFPVATVQRPLEFGRDVTRTGSAPALLRDVKLSEFTFFRGELTSAQVISLATGTDPKNLDGSPTPTIPEVSVSFSPVGSVGSTSTTFTIQYSATEGSAFELWSSTDLASDWILINANVPGTGTSATVSPAINPTTTPKRFFQLRQK